MVFPNFSFETVKLLGLGEEKTFWKYVLSQPLKCFQILSSSFHLNIKAGKGSSTLKAGVCMPLSKVLCCLIHLSLSLFASWESNISLIFLLALADLYSICWQAADIFWQVIWLIKTAREGKQGEEASPEANQHIRNAEHGRNTQKHIYELALKKKKPSTSIVLKSREHRKLRLALCDGLAGWDEGSGRQAQEGRDVSHSIMSDSVTPWNVAYPTLSMEFSCQEYWSGLYFLLQGIFLTLGLNPGLLHCRQILYCLSH